MQPEFYIDKDSGYLIFVEIVHDYKSLCIDERHFRPYWLFGVSMSSWLSK
ncbi:hypothetical protein Q5794_29600 (plasmid) [Priestia megaterium]